MLHKFKFRVVAVLEGLGQGERFKAKSYLESNKKSVYQTILKGQIISNRKGSKKAENMGSE